MCYSPEADLIAGLVVGAFAIDAVRHTDDKRYLALASVPIVLATHQVIEAVAWWGLEGQVSPTAGRVAASVYLIIAFGLVPVLVPYAARRCEPVRRRRLAMLPFVVLGAAVATVLVASLLIEPHSAEVGGRYIAYSATIPAAGLVTFLYFVAVCTPLLVSSHRRLVVLGALNVPAFVALSVLLGSGLISLWCIWAAVTSLVIARQVREGVAVPTSEASGMATVR